MNSVVQRPPDVILIVTIVNGLAKPRALTAKTGGVGVDDQQRADLAEWARNARQRSRKSILDAVQRRRRFRRIMFETDYRMDRTDDDYQRGLPALDRRAQLPPRQIEAMLWQAGGSAPISATCSRSPESND